MTDGAVSGTLVLFKTKASLFTSNIYTLHTYAACFLSIGWSDPKGKLLFILTRWCVSSFTMTADMSLDEASTALRDAGSKITGTNKTTSPAIEVAPPTDTIALPLLPSPGRSPGLLQHSHSRKCRQESEWGVSMDIFPTMSCSLNASDLV